MDALEYVPFFLKITAYFYYAYGVVSDKFEVIPGAAIDAATTVAPRLGRRNIRVLLYMGLGQIIVALLHFWWSHGDVLMFAVFPVAFFALFGQTLLDHGRAVRAERTGQVDRKWQ